MTLENVLYTANAHTTRGRENGTARTDDGHLDVRLSPAAVSSILIFTANWSPRMAMCVCYRPTSGSQNRIDLLRHGMIDLY
jgi:hypothetical protein